MELSETIPGVDRYLMLNKQFSLEKLQRLFYIFDEKLCDLYDSGLSPDCIPMYKCTCERYNQNTRKLPSRYSGIKKFNAAIRIQKHYRHQVRREIEYRLENLNLI